MIKMEIDNAEETSGQDEEQSVGKGIGFERIRRITGYLVGRLEKFNNAKRAEERDRIKHDRYTKGSC